MLYFVNSLIFIVKISPLLMVFFLVRVFIYIECLFLCFVFHYCAIDFDIYKTNLIVHLPSSYVSVIDFFFFFVIIVVVQANLYVLQLIPHDSEINRWVNLRRS